MACSAYQAGVDTGDTLRGIISEGIAAITWKTANELAPLSDYQVFKDGNLFCTVDATPVCGLERSYLVTDGVHPENSNYEVKVMSGTTVVCTHLVPFD